MEGWAPAVRIPNGAGGAEGALKDPEAAVALLRSPGRGPGAPPPEATLT